jgi:hypothetical protein
VRGQLANEALAHAENGMHLELVHRSILQSTGRKCNVFRVTQFFGALSEHANEGQRVKLRWQSMIDRRTHTQMSDNGSQGPQTTKNMPKTTKTPKNRHLPWIMTRIAYLEYNAIDNTNQRNNYYNIAIRL